MNNENNNDWVCNKWESFKKNRNCKRSVANSQKVSTHNVEGKQGEFNTQKSASKARETEENEK